MIEAAGLIGLGVLLVALAPFGYYHKSWRSPWRFAGTGLAMILLGAILLLLGRVW